MLNPLENLLTQGFASQSPESADKFQADILEGEIIHMKEKARDEIMERVARTLGAAGIEFRLGKRYILVVEDAPEEHRLLVKKAVEIATKYGDEEIIFEN